MRKFSLLLLIIIGVQVFMVNTLANDDLPVLVLTGSEDDHHRMNEAIHGAHALAEVGAGYEAARVLAAIALQVRDSDLGNEAVHLLNEWGLTVNPVRQRRHCKDCQCNAGPSAFRCCTATCSEPD